MRTLLAVESTLKRDEEQAELLLDAVLTHRREASAKEKEFKGLPTFRVGVAGPPGAGKSTFIETLGQYLTARNHKVAVLAIGTFELVARRIVQRIDTAWH